MITSIQLAGLAFMTLLDIISFVGFVFYQLKHTHPQKIETDRFRNAGGFVIACFLFICLNVLSMLVLLGSITGTEFTISLLGVMTWAIVGGAIMYGILFKAITPVGNIHADGTKAPGHGTDVQASQ